MGTLIQWLSKGAVPVDHRVAEKRALVCATCPKNSRGGVRHFFTKKAARAIQHQIERKNDLALYSSVDELLGLCTACGCWAALKIHTPEKDILDHLKPTTKAKLDPECWIRKLTGEKQIR